MWHSRQQWSFAKWGVWESVSAANCAKTMADSRSANRTVLPWVRPLNDICIKRTTVSN